MVPFEEYISFWSVTDVLISKRIQICDKRHKKHMLHMISPSVAENEPSEEDKKILSLMPTRRHWVSIRKESRYEKLQLPDGIYSQKKSAMRCNWIAIKRRIIKDKESNNQQDYLVNLETFVTRIKQRVTSNEFVLEKPEIFPQEKDENSCRPLCRFANLEDSIIIILANKYLTELFNRYFYEESLAFRSRRDYHGEKNYTTAHHDAIKRIKEYRERYESQKLYVSECDLQKFYDTVNHRVVRKSYYDLLKQVHKENPDVSFESINRVFEGYLKCYSFPSSVWSLNKKTEFWDKYKINKEQRHFKWVEKELIRIKVSKSQKGLMRKNIGVPQGGALSGLIANMVLNSVDLQVNKAMKRSDLYLRYCDDMIIISTNRRRCKKLFKIYYAGTIDLKLIPHDPEKKLDFGQKGFWNSKSKDVYFWAMKKHDASEWITFVGYDIRRDGITRIRKKSFRKELNKQKSVIFEKTLDKIYNRQRVSDDSLIKSLQSKLISMSVGKIAVWNSKYYKSEMCWSVGFKELDMNSYSSRQLRELDRHRRMMLSAAERRIASMKPNKDPVKRKDVNQVEDKNPDTMGIVHSYYYQFKKK